MSSIDNECDDDHSVTSAEVDLAIDNNGTWSDAFQFGDVGDFTWDLFSSNFEMDVKRNRYDLTPLLHLDLAGGRIVIADPVQRVIYLNVASVDIQAALAPGEYVYDLVMIDVNGVRIPLMHGDVEVTQGVTQS